MTWDGKRNAVYSLFVSFLFVQRFSVFHFRPLSLAFYFILSSLEDVHLEILCFGESNQFDFQCLQYQW